MVCFLSRLCMTPLHGDAASGFKKKYDTYPFVRDQYHNLQNLESPQHVSPGGRPWLVGVVDLRRDVITGLLCFVRQCLERWPFDVDRSLLMVTTTINQPHNLSQLSATTCTLIVTAAGVWCHGTNTCCVCGESRHRQGDMPLVVLLLLFYVLARSKVITTGTDLGQRALMVIL